MSYRKCRCRTGNSNGVLGDTDRRNCNGVLGANDPCNRRNYPAADALEDAYNEGYNKGYCDGVKAGREQGYCEGYEQGAVDGCQNVKHRALDCIITNVLFSKFTK